VVSDDG
jgi:hypothetical protein